MNIYAIRFFKKSNCKKENEKPYMNHCLDLKVITKIKVDVLISPIDFEVKSLFTKH